MFGHPLNMQVRGSSNSACACLPPIPDDHELMTGGAL